MSAKLQNHFRALRPVPVILRCEVTAFTSKRKGLSRYSKHDVTDNGANRYPLPVLCQNHIYTHIFFPFIVLNITYLYLRVRLLYDNKTYLPKRKSSPAIALAFPFEVIYSFFGRMIMFISVFVRERVTGNAFVRVLYKNSIRISYFPNLSLLFQKNMYICT